MCQSITMSGGASLITIALRWWCHHIGDSVPSGDRCVTPCVCNASIHVYTNGLRGICDVYTFITPCILSPHHHTTLYPPPGLTTSATSLISTWTLPRHQLMPCYVTASTSSSHECATRLLGKVHVLHVGLMSLAARYAYMGQGPEHGAKAVYTPGMALLMAGPLL